MAEWPSTREDLSDDSWLDVGDLPEHLFVSTDAPWEFQQLWDLHPEEHHEIVIYGQPHQTPRWQQAYGRDYAFSGGMAKAAELPEEFEPYLEWANELGYGEFNQFLVNWYADGNHYIGSHADDEGPLRKNSPIVTITLCGEGDARTFRIRNKKTKEIVRDVETTNGLVMIMGGRFQQEFKHEIVKVTGKRAESMAPSISITLRQFR